MPEIFEVEGPDGHLYEVEAPDGATLEQVQAATLETLGGMAEKPKNKNWLETLKNTAGLGVKAIDGATLNAFPYVQAAGATVPAKLGLEAYEMMGGPEAPSMGDIYKQARDIGKEDRRATEEQHPILSPVAEMGGAVGSGILTGGTNMMKSLTQAPTTMGRMMKAAPVAGASGFTAGALGNEGEAAEKLVAGTGSGILSMLMAPAFIYGGEKAIQGIGKAGEKLSKTKVGKKIGSILNPDKVDDVVDDTVDKAKKTFTPKVEKKNIRMSEGDRLQDQQLQSFESTALKGGHGKAAQEIAEDFRAGQQDDIRETFSVLKGKAAIKKPTRVKTPDGQETPLDDFMSQNKRAQVYDEDPNNLEVIKNGNTIGKILPEVDTTINEASEAVSSTVDDIATQVKAARASIKEAYDAAKAGGKSKGLRISNKALKPLGSNIKRVISQDYDPRDHQKVKAFLKELDDLITTPEGYELPKKNIVKPTSTILNTNNKKVGDFDFEEFEDFIQINGVSIKSKSNRGQGFASKAYKDLADYAASSNKEIISDSMVSKDAARVYQSLKKAGYKVQKNPDAYLDDAGDWVTEDDSPVFTIIPNRQKKVSVKRVSQWIGDLEKWRKRISNKSHDMRISDPTEARILRQMRNSYDNYMEQISDEFIMQGDASAIQAFREARKKRIEFGKLYESNKVVKRIMESTREGGDPLTIREATNLIFGADQITGKKESVKTMRALMKATGDAEGTKSKFKQSIVMQMLEGGKTTEVTAEGVELISPNKLNKGVKKLLKDKELIGELFTPEEITELEGISSTLAKIASKKPGAVNNSNTFEKLMGHMNKIPFLSLVPKAVDAAIKEPMSAKKLSKLLGDTHKELARSLSTTEFASSVAGGQATAMGVNSIFNAGGQNDGN